MFGRLIFGFVGNNKADIFQKLYRPGTVLSNSYLKLKKSNSTENMSYIAT